MASPDPSAMAVIVNRSSGWDDKNSTLARIQEILSGARIELVRKGVECGEVARHAVRGGARAVVAAGGDGTVRAVAETLAGTDVPLGGVLFRTAAGRLRRRRALFAEARRFLAHLPQPQIVVPGNHDMPFYNPVLRLIRGLDEWIRIPEERALRAG